MEHNESLGPRQTRFLEESRMLINLSHDTHERAVEALNTTTNPIVTAFAKSTTHFGNVTKESQTLETPATLAHLTEEFDHLTHKMNRLKEALKYTSAGSGKKIGPTLINSSSQALQIANLQHVFDARQSIRDCMVELMFADHFLNGNEELSSNYREKLRNAMMMTSVNLDASPRRLADVAAETSEDFTKRERRAAEMQTDAIEMNMSSLSANGPLTHRAV